MEQADSSRWQRPPAAAKHLKRSESSLAKLRMTGGGPPYSKVGRLVLYDIHDLDVWVAANTRHSTSEEASDPGREGRDYEEPEVIERPEARAAAVRE